jgi:protein-tyrosine phosphatase
VRLTFVCTGNICRSPIAALEVDEHLRRAGFDDVEVTSGGTGPWHVGEAADPRTQKVLADHGYPTAHVASQVGPEHLAADLIVAMDAGHHRELRRLGADPDKLRMFRSFDPDADSKDVPDPYVHGLEDFEVVLTMVEAAVPGLVQWVRENR